MSGNYNKQSWHNCWQLFKCLDVPPLFFISPDPVRGLWSAIKLATFNSIACGSISGLCMHAVYHVHTRERSEHSF